jgi:uncharacterized protein (DUF1810 family)
MTLERFLEAQHTDYDVAMRELRAGRKRSHWIWYVFPQIAGLGSSYMAEKYALAGVDEARAYLADDTLRARLAEGVAIVRAQVVANKIPLATLMGSHIDALKLVSCLTLFEPLAREAKLEDLAADAGAILDAAAAQGFPRCAHTTRALAAR